MEEIVGKNPPTIKFTFEDYRIREHGACQLLPRARKSTRN